MTEKAVYHITFSRHLFAEEWYVLATSHYSAILKAIKGSRKEKGIWWTLRDQDALDPIRITNIHTSFNSLDAIFIGNRSRNVRLLP